MVCLGNMCINTLHEGDNDDDDDDDNNINNPTDVGTALLSPKTRRHNPRVRSLELY